MDLYLSRDLLLLAVNGFKLLANGEEVKQGVTQDVSAIRHCLALSRLLNKEAITSVKLKHKTDPYLDDFITYVGDIVKFGGTTTVPGAIYQLQGGGTWALTDADAAASASGSIAVALGANSTTNGMLLRGLSKLNHDPGGLVGAPLYLAVAAGSSSNAVPSSD